MQNGLYLDKLSIANITIKNTYIKWNNKLNISIDELNIKQSATNTTTPKINLKDINKYISYTSHFFLLTESVVIKKLQYKDMTINFKHTYNENGFLKITSPSLTLDSQFQFQKNSVVFDLNKLQTLHNKIFVNGELILNLKEEEVYSKLNILINNDANLTLFAIANKERLNYKIKSHQDIKHIQELVSLFHLPKEIKYWTMDAIQAPSLTIHKIRGFIQYNDIESAYRNVYVLASVNKLNYTYNPKLDAIHTKRTELEFLNGVLYIRPKKAYSYGMYLNKSWLKIDFTKKEELLTLYLLFNGKLNKDMLRILRTYNIKLPFLQHTGSVKTDLVISVNLKSIKINAKGTFYTKKANFDYLGLNIDIADTTIKLNNYDVNIPHMKAQYKDIAKADVSVKYNAKRSKGNINFNFSKIKLNKTYHLDTNYKKLHAVYKISPHGDQIIAQKSHWIADKLRITLDPLKLPFNLKTLHITIPTTYYKVDKLANGFITGEADIKHISAKLKIDLLHFHYNDIKLAQSNVVLNLIYDKNLKITSQENISFTISGSLYKIKKLNIYSDFKTISLKNTDLQIGNYISTQINTRYKFKTQTADINLNNFILKNPHDKTILYYSNKTKLLLKKSSKGLQVTSDALKADFKLLKDRWELNLNSIKRIAKNSKLLQKYKITNGTIHFYKKTEEKYTKFRANIHYKYKLMTDLNRPISDYKITGYLTKSQHIYMTINKNLNIKIADTIKLNLQNSGINLEDLLEFIKLVAKKKEKNSTKQKTPNILFRAANSYIYVGNNRYILSDTINLQYYNNITTAQLQYANGKANFRLEGEKFHLYGEKFNDKFMEQLFSLSKFKGGSLEFSLNGILSDYKGTFFIKNTTIQDYVLLNNILAFINTVPSLATFSLPGYNKNGLYLSDAYMKFHLKNHIFHISDIYINSKEIKILGKGTASVKYDTIDLTLNLKTDIGSNLSKIPVVGYLIFDGQSLSTSLKITGKLTDPKVTTMLAKDIAVAPLNIIQRTLTLPYKLLKDLSDLNNSQK